MHAIYDCTRELQVDVAIPDLDQSLIQEVIGLARLHPELMIHLMDMVGYVCAMMDCCQNKWFGFECLYHEVMEAAVLDTEEDPIIVKDVSA